MVISSNTALISSAVYAPLGAPTLPTELNIQPTDIELALNKYYTYIPIKKTHTYQFSSNREIAQSITELLPGPDYFYVGVLAFASRLQTVSPRLNEYLLGTTYAFPNAEPLKQSYYNTVLNENLGDTYYEEDEPNDKINWVVGGTCTLSVTYGIGHNSIDSIPRRHVQLMSYLVGETYYNRLLAIRKTAEFSGSDFSINTALLEDALKRAQTEGQGILDSISYVPVTIG